MNAIERGVVLSRAEFLVPEDLPMIPTAPFEAPECPTVEPSQEGLTLEEAEKIAVMRAMQASGGNKSQAARQLRITRKTLQTKLKKYGQLP